MKTRPLIASEINFEVEERPNYTLRWRCYGSLKSLSMVNHVIWVRGEKFNREGVFAQMALELNRKLRRMLDRVEPFLAAPEPPPEGKCAMMLYDIVYGDDAAITRAIEAAKTLLQK